MSSSQFTKETPTQYPVHDLIAKRWSPRAFSERPVSPEKVRSLLEAARWSASSMNQQPWRFIVATPENPEAREKLLSALKDSNQKWAKRAPVLIGVVAQAYFDSGAPNRHAWHDVGLAVSQLTLQATDLGLGVHQMAGFYPDQVREDFSVPPEFEPVSILAVGFPDSPDVLDEYSARRERAPRSRRGQDEIAFGDTWGESW